jgi:cytochrome b561
MILSFVAVMPEILHMSNNVRRARNTADRYESLQMHLRWALCLKSFAVIGFALAYWSKLRRGKSHFKGLHSSVGAVCIAVLSLQIIAGLIFHFRLAKPSVNVLLRKLHFWLGLTVLLLGCGSVALGFTTHYGERAAGSQLMLMLFYSSAAATCSWAYLRE